MESLRAEVTVAQNTVVRAREEMAEQLQRERAKMAKDKDKLSAEARASQRIAEASSTARDAAVKVACCSVLQFVGSVWQCVVVCCSVSQCVAVCCSVLQCDAV